MAPLVMPHRSTSLPGPRSPPGNGSESGRAPSRARAEPGSPNTRRLSSRSKTVEGAGLALLEMTGGGSAPASPRAFRTRPGRRASSLDVHTHPARSRDAADDDTHRVEISHARATGA